MRRLKTSLCRKLLRTHAYKTGEITAELIFGRAALDFNALH
jgi:hypothetical protein